MLKNVTDVFDKTIVLLNTSNIIDMKWVDEYNIDSVLYIWQGRSGRAEKPLPTYSAVISAQRQTD